MSQTSVYLNLYHKLDALRCAGKSNSNILVVISNDYDEQPRVAVERVKGIEPSYSAWKAAALPLSYTRAGAGLSRRGGGLNRSCAPALPAVPGAGRRPGARPLTSTDSVPILCFPSTMKGGDPVSYTKRCHLAGIAR